MIYEIDYLFCAISGFIFKNFFTFALFIVISYLLMKYLISKLSNITIILYSMFVVSLFAGSIVLLLLPASEDKLGNTVVNSYYLGTVAFLLYIALFISLIVDAVKLFSEINNKKTVKKKIVKEIKETKVEPKKEIIEKKESTNTKVKSVKPKTTETKKKVVKKTVKKPAKKSSSKTKAN